MNNKNIILNIEASNYSKIARETLEKYCNYYESTWDTLDNQIAEQTTILIVRLEKYIDKNVLNKFKNLKIIISATTGVDHIDINYIKKNKIKLLSLRGEEDFLKSIPSTAEHTWALLMSLIRNIPSANNSVKENLWNRDLYRGYQLKNKTIGIIGLGRTGLMVAHYAIAFEMNIIYYDPFVLNKSFKKVENLNALIENSDIITIHVHLNKSTINLLNTNLNKIKLGAYLINTSRGRILNEKIAVSLLKKGIIKGIASDVLSTELVDIKKSPLFNAFIENENIIITPHIGGATFDAMHQTEEFMATKLIKYIK